MRGTGVHAVMGIGGAPEGVITAAAMRCLGGEIQAPAQAQRLNEEQKRRSSSGSAPSGSTTSPRSTRPKSWPRATQILFSCSGVTDGELLRGVRFFGGGSRTSTLFMSLSRKIIRFVDTIHREQVTTPVRFI